MHEYRSIQNLVIASLLKQQPARMTIPMLAITIVLKGSSVEHGAACGLNHVQDRLFARWGENGNDGNAVQTMKHQTGKASLSVTTKHKDIQFNLNRTPTQTTVRAHNGVTYEGAPNQNQCTIPMTVNG